MQKKLLEKLCCPFDKEELQIQVFHEDEQGEIHQGLLTCAHCNRYYPIIYGIPIMTPDEYRQKALELPVMQKWGFEIAEGDHTFQLKEGAVSKEIAQEGDK